MAPDDDPPREPAAPEPSAGEPSAGEPSAGEPSAEPTAAESSAIPVESEPTHDNRTKPSRKPRSRKSEPKVASRKSEPKLPKAAKPADPAAPAKPKPRRSRKTPLSSQQPTIAESSAALAAAASSAALAAAASSTSEPDAYTGIDLGNLPLDPLPPDATPPPMIPVRVGEAAAAAALEAARIVSEIVDIDTPTGAVIAAAAAAGAAIEVVRAGAQPDDPASDPHNTTRLSRESILRAITDEPATPAAAAAVAAADAASDAPQSAAAPAAAFAALEAAAAPGTRAQTSPGFPRAQTSPGVPRAQTAPTFPRAQTAPTFPRAQTAPTFPRAQTNPSIAAAEADAVYEDAATAEPAAAAEEEELDPVQLAAAVIQRLRARARDNVAELRGHYHRLDLVVIVVALVIIAAAGRVHAYLATPPDVAFPSPADADHGLQFQHPAAWLRAPTAPLLSPRLVHDIVPATAIGPRDAGPYHVELTSPIDADARIEVLVDKKPAWSNIVTNLDLERRTRWGELYSLDDSDVLSIEGHQWLRTEYQYAHAAGIGDVPRVGHAVEYATIDRDQIYVVTLFGTPAEIEELEGVVAPSLRVATPSALPLVPQTGRLAQRTFPTGVAAAFNSTVMVVVADVIDGRLKARGGGSGIVVGRDGSILTNYHVIHDKDGRLHDVFVIGRFSAPDSAPQLMCAGRPSRSKLQRELDLALVKCDLDLDGRAWSAAQAAPWPTLATAPPRELHVGQRLWVLGYPDVGGGGLTLYQGQVEGWDGGSAAPGIDFIKTDAPISNGNSGGPVVDDSGRLVGVASAYRTKVTANGGFVKSAQVGLVRPIAAAAALVNIAITGWTPREGHTDVEIAPDAIEAAPTGVLLTTRVLDASNLVPIRDALVMVLRPGVTASTIDVNALNDQVLAWGRSNANGDVQLKEPVPVPGSYTVLVNASGYQPLIDDTDLAAGSDNEAAIMPWPQILLHAR